MATMAAGRRGRRGGLHFLSWRSALADRARDPGRGQRAADGARSSMARAENWRPAFPGEATVAAMARDRLGDPAREIFGDDSSPAVGPRRNRCRAGDNVAR